MLETTDCLITQTILMIARQFQIASVSDSYAARVGSVCNASSEEVSMFNLKLLTTLLVVALMCVSPLAIAKKDKGPKPEDRLDVLEPIVEELQALVATKQGETLVLNDCLV